MIINADALIEHYLENVNKELAKICESQILFLKATMAQPIDDLIRLEIEELCKLEGFNNKLTVIVETTGGYIEVVERIVRIFRENYEIVDFIVPNYAYSAGTILVMSGDDIYMDYHSVLGPIDPQFESENGDYVPGMGYLSKFQELMTEINSAGESSEVRGQIAYLVQKFDPAKLLNIPKLY